MQSAVKAQREGRLEHAIQGYRAVLRDHPGFTEAHNNLAVALKASGRVAEAIESFRRAVSVRPEYAAAHANLAWTLHQIGKSNEAFPHAVLAVRLEPQNHSHKSILTETLRPMQLTQASPDVLKAIRDCFEWDGIEHQLISTAVLSLLRHHPALGKTMSTLKQSGQGVSSRALRKEELASLFGIQLLHFVLSKTLVAAVDFEDFLTHLRSCCLEVLREDQEGSASHGWLLDQGTALFAALAKQCFINGYVYRRTPDDERALDNLRRQLESRPPTTAELCVLAMFQPLHELADADRFRAWNQTLDANGRSLVEQQVFEPETERALERDLAVLTPVREGVSQAVQDQYEANPYPRWFSVSNTQPRPIREVLDELFPHIEVTQIGPGPHRILVAGCGTGKHAIRVAQRFQDSDVLAIDLSRTSLAYAQRKALEFGVSGIRFAQADILELGTLGEDFDLIESVGVLHHLEDPLEAWRRLHGLLRQGGLMKIGLYSEKAREVISAAQAFVRQEGYSAKQDDIKAARQALVRLPENHPASGIKRQHDFYSLNGCRDLLFNVQEATLTLPRIKQWLEALDLKFLGFEFRDRQTADAYCGRFPEDPEMTNLKLWDRFEQENPQTFSTMYQFWCQKN